MPTRGFTLLELLISLTLLALLLTIGVPSLSDQVRNSRTRTHTLEFYQAVQLTRTQAVNANGRATLRSRGGWDQGWQLFLDPNHNGVRDDGEKLIVERGPSEGLQVEGNRPVSSYISFIGTGESRFATGRFGGGFQAGTLTVCPEKAGDGYKLVLARSGRMRIREIEGEECL